MRIVLSNASFKWGGVHRVTEQLAEGLERRGHEVVVFCRPKSALEERLRGRYTTISIARGMDFSPLALFRIRRALRRVRAQVVLTLMDKDLRLTGAAAWWLGLPVIARRANDKPLDGGVYSRFIYGRIASHHIANSQATRDTILQSLPTLPAERVSVIYNGVDYDAIASAAPAQLPIPRASVVVGFIGRLEPRKGILDLLDAWPQVAAAVPAAQLIIVGRGPLEEEVHRRSDAVERAVFLGYREDVGSVLQRCAVVAIPSHWEGFGLVAAEALAAGKPVVASNTSSLPEIVRHESEGLLIPPRDPPALASALTRLLKDDTLRAQLGKKGAERVRTTFNSTRMIADYEQLMLRFVKR
jgi:glycosyltransferase involved in cell wall biosynthesis